MGTLIKLSDGEQVRLNSDYDGMVTVIGAAFRRDHGATKDDRGRILQNGFLVLHDVAGEEILINAGQIVSARRIPNLAEAALGAEPAEPHAKPLMAGIRDQQF